ncbi:hypothetical protein TNCV_3627921 [Trichonephila clavipes]|nr:hypothetical protein TNCV_3627921 [Trichonephila clavipes]
MVSYVLSEPKVASFILCIGDLDAELRKEQPSRSYRGPIYPPQKQSSRQIYMTQHSSRQTHLTQQQQLTRLPYQLYRSCAFSPTHWKGSVWRWHLYKPLTASRLK